MAANPRIDLPCRTIAPETSGRAHRIRVMEKTPLNHVAKSSELKAAAMCRYFTYRHFVNWQEKAK